MLRNSNRNIKILGAAWLALGGLAFAIALVGIATLIIDPSEAEDGFWGGAIFVLIILVLGAIQTVNGLALLRRHPVARPVLAISSLVLIIPSTVGAVTGIGVPFLLVVAASLWLTFSRGGKKALESYMARENG